MIASINSIKEPALTMRVASTAITAPQSEILKFQFFYKNKNIFRNTSNEIDSSFSINIYMKNNRYLILLLSKNRQNEGYCHRRMNIKI